jgi:hypothetical protein
MMSLVRGVSLLVDAVGVELQQGRDSVPRCGSHLTFLWTVDPAEGQMKPS